MSPRTRQEARGRDRSRPRPTTALLAGPVVAGSLLLSGCTAGAATAEPPTVTSAPASPAAPSPTTPSPTTPSPDEAPPTQPAPEEPAPEEPAPTEPSPTVAPETPPAEPAAEEPTLLQRGDEGEAVLALQQRLMELDYFLPDADADFGAATQQAVWALQKAAGLQRDGLVGAETLAALDAGTRPAAVTTTGRAIEVDLDRQLLLAVEDGVVVRVVNASSGNGETYRALGRQQHASTPTGDFTVVRQIDGVRESSLELGAMYRPKYFLKGWAVHGSASIPPWPASHGCVRVSNAAMDWIWDVWGAPPGTQLLVR